MSRMASASYSSTGALSPSISRSDAAYSVVPAIAFSKIDGLDVTPRRPSSAMSRPNLPLVNKPRRRSSSHTDCPNRCSAVTGFEFVMWRLLLDLRRCAHATGREGQLVHQTLPGGAL